MMIKVGGWKRLVLLILTGVLFLLASFISITNTQAQASVSLTVSPAVSDVPAGNEVSLQLVVAGGIDVNAYDVTIEFDEEKLELMSWECGEYLSNQYVIYKEDQPGHLRLAATQLATPGVSGDGVLLVLVFTAIKAGTVNVEITDAELADPDGNLTYPERVPGEVQVTNDPTYTVTPSSTPTLTNTPTPTKTDDSADKGTQTPNFTQTPTRTTFPSATHTPIYTQTTGIIFSNTFTPSATVTATEEIEREEIATFTHTPTGTDVQDRPQGTAQQIQETQTTTPIIETILSTDQAKTLNLFLWGILVAGLSAIVIMLIALVRRKIDDHEDLLL